MVYRFDGFLQPLNDTARVPGATTSSRLWRLGVALDDEQSYFVTVSLR